MEQEAAKPSGREKEKRRIKKQLYNFHGRFNRASTGTESSISSVNILHPPTRP
jgi:hypothetical protein